MQIGYNSPEAFEEVLWRAFWPEKYSDTSIELWEAADSKHEGHAFFVEHMKKIIALRRPDRNRDGRYISKNNGNVARLDLIGCMFPDAKILVPFRHPVDHAVSLLRQHRNFIEIQKTKPFIRRYMADLGHYEFGYLHRPITFPGVNELISDRNPLTADYWLGYWIAAFEHVLARRDAVMLVSYEVACANARSTLAEICARLEIAEEGTVDKAATLFRAPSLREFDESELDQKLHGRAEDLHKSLIDAAR